MILYAFVNKGNTIPPVTKTHFLKISRRHRYFVLPQAAGLRNPEWYFTDLKFILKAITENN